MFEKLYKTVDSPAAEKRLWLCLSLVVICESMLVYILGMVSKGRKGPTGGWTFICWLE